MLNFLRKKKVSSALEKNNRKKEFLNYDSITKIMLLFNLKDWDDVKGVIENLDSDGKEVAIWTTRSKDKADISLPDRVRAIDMTKEISWSQSVAKPVLNEFEKADYDTLLDLTSLSDGILEYLLAINTSKFCVGIRESEAKVYDFVLLKKEEDSILSTFEQMKYYLGKIK